MTTIEEDVVLKIDWSEKEQTEYKEHFNQLTEINEQIKNEELNLYLQKSTVKDLKTKREEIKHQIDIDMVKFLSTHLILKGDY